MENQTAFDLNLAIRRWREDLAHSSAFRNENLNELESHLRDSVDRLRTRELSDEEVFLIATRRVGNTQRLEQEFGKVNSAGVWFDRFLWVLVAVQIWSLIGSTSSLLIAFMSPLCAWLNEFLPGFGLPKIGEDWIQTGTALVFSRIATAIAAALVWRYCIWPKRRGSALLKRLLRQPGILALGLFVMCIVFNFGAAWAMQTWYWPSIYHSAYPGLFRLFVFSLPSVVLWAGLTYFIARKRLRSSVA
jgi:hypothetical protein